MKELLLTYFHLPSVYFVSPLFLFHSVSVYLCKLVVFHVQMLSIPFSYVSWIPCRFLLYGYQETYIKYLIDKTVNFMLIATYTHSPIKAPLFTHPLLYFWWGTIYRWMWCCQAVNRRQGLLCNYKQLWEALVAGEFTCGCTLYPPCVCAEVEAHNGHQVGGMWVHSWRGKPGTRAWRWGLDKDA